MIKPLSCPTCHKTLPVELTSASPLFPFCSERCRQVDLFRWFDGRFQIVEPSDPELASAMDEELGDET